MTNRSEFSGPIINKKRGGLGRSGQTNEDKVFGLVCCGVATTEYATLGTIVPILSIDDAEALGFTAAYDAANKVLVWNRIARFFEYEPLAKLWLMVVPQATTQTEMWDKEDANKYVYKLITDETVNREIRVVMTARNPPATGYTPTYTTGLETDVVTASAKAAELIADLLSKFIYVDGAVIEGRLQANAAIATLPDLAALNDEAVTISIAQDPALASLDAAFARYADVESVGGMLAVRKVSECLGSVNVANKPDAFKGSETYSLTRDARGYYISAQISSGKKYSELSENEKIALANKRYVFSGKYEGIDGIYFNDSHTNIEALDDYAYIEDNRVWNKAARKVRRALLPIMKGEIEVDPTTGFLPDTQIASYQEKGKNSVKSMVQANEIAGEPTIVIEPNQDVVGTGKVFMAISYVRNGILRVLEADLGATNPAA